MRRLAALCLAALALLGAGAARGRTTIVLDPGHGGRDTGAKVGRVYEKHLNLDLAYRVAGYLKRKGYPVRLTRSSDVFVSLGARAAIANRYRKAVVVSLHFNYTTRRSVRGIETFHTGTSKGRALAYHIHRAAVRATGARDRGVRTRHFYVLRNTKHPAVLVEGGFLTNSTERRLVCTGGYRDKLARGIAEGIARGVR